MKSRFFITFCFFTLFISCQTYNSTMDSNEPTIYTTDEDTILSISYDSFRRVFPKEVVLDGNSDNSAVSRGFYVDRYLLGDRYITALRILEGIGITDDGKKINGYYFEVIGSGTLFDGPTKDKKLFSSIDTTLKSLGYAVKCKSITRADFIKDAEKIVISKENDSVESKLTNLENLYKKGLITEDEYIQKRNEILDTF